MRQSDLREWTFRDAYVLLRENSNKHDYSAKWNYIGKVKKVIVDKSSGYTHMRLRIKILKHLGGNEYCERGTWADSRWESYKIVGIPYRKERMLFFIGCLHNKIDDVKIISRDDAIMEQL